ncbi:MAG TPA: RnfH family protein [Pseudomonas sp.]|uniref:RnfH family protein n=1 Tax=Pseudomonas sp. TaxID=306 RepID=UPI002EDA5D80
MAEAMISVEVVYAAVDRQALLSVDVPVGSTVREALAASGIGAAFPELDLQQCPVGIFGKRESDPQTRVLENGDRIEIYRQLLADPKETRRLRAAKAAQAKKDQRAI